MINNNYYSIVVFYRLLIVVSVSARILIDDGTGPTDRWNQPPGNPGVRLRLTTKGANHVKTIAVKLLNEQIPLLKGINTQHKFSRPGLDGVVDLQDIHVVAYRPADISVINFRPPRTIVFGIENMDITLAGRFVGRAGPFTVPGAVKGDLKGITIGMATDLANVDGHINVHVTNCSTLVGLSQFTIDAEGPLGPIVKTFESHINDAIREQIPTILCRTFTRIVDNNGPKLFDRLVQTPLDTPFKNAVQKTVFDSFIKKLTMGLILDNLNIADPIITENYFETQQKGEVRYATSRLATPFYPLPMNTSNDADRMLYLYGSDYLFNSLLYHAYEHDRLSIKLEQNNLPAKYQPFLMTTCASNSSDDDVFKSLCVGSLIPSLQDNYPNTTASFVLLPHSVPQFQFADQRGSLDAKNGAFLITLYGHFSARIITYARDAENRKRQVLVSSADGQADVKLRAEKSRVAGDLKLNKLDLRLHRSALNGMNPKAIEQLAPLAKTFLGPLLSKGLKEGVPFPLQDTITFIDPQLSIQDGYAQLATDFVLGEAALRKKLTEAFKKGIADFTNN